MSDGLTCPICFDAFSFEPDSVPRILPCGHTLCTKCATGVTKDGYVKCPNRCAEEAKVGAKGASGLPRNFALLSMRTDNNTTAAEEVDFIKVEFERLQAAKKAAIADEDYDKAKQIKIQIDALQVRAASQDAVKEKIAALQAQKAQALESEDFDLAKKLKAEIDQLQQQAASSGEQKGEEEAVCYELGPGLGALLRIMPKPVAKMSGRRPLAVVVLDRSPSMGGTVRWAVNIAVPAALAKLGYQDDEKCVLLTFDSQTERVGAAVQRGVARARMDPTVHQLKTLDVSSRGTTTLLAPVVPQIRDVLMSQEGPCNVFVISDGHVFDLPLVRSRADAVRTEVSGLRAVSFALFRFFNGDPPDTAALSAVASVGTYGIAPCSDCFPPAQWTCPACTFLNPYSVQRCELCQGAAPAGGSAGVDTSLATFVDTAYAAFAASVGVHAKVRTEVPLRRLPCGQPESGEVEVPEGRADYFLLDRPLSTVYINERKVSVPLAGIPDDQLDAFCTNCLAQLRIWLVGGTRKNELQSAVEWFRRLSVLRQSVEGAVRAREGANLMLRAESLRARTMEGESSLGRICSLANAASIIEELNSKQQGDYLRGGSIRRVELSLSRRALGSDIIYHDALKRAITNLPPFEFKDGKGDAAAGPPGGLKPFKERTIVSYYSGCTYTDVMKAACVLKDCAADIPTAEILGVVGGVGCPFVAALPARVDDIWSWEFSFVDATSFLMEADVWCAKSNGEALTVANMPVAGVVPLSYCDPEMHEIYQRDLEAVALLHVGSQLRGAPPTQAWGWQASPPWSLQQAAGARETAALCCVARDYIGGAKKVSLQQATLAIGLAEQILHKHEALTTTEIVATAARILKGEKGVERRSLPFYAAALCEMAREAKESLSPLNARELYSREVSKAADKAGVALRATPQQAVARLEALMQLLANNVDNQRIVASEAAIMQEMNQGFGLVESPGLWVEAEVEVDSTLAPPATIASRLSQLNWLPSTDTVFGVCRVLRVLTSMGTGFTVATAAEKLTTAPAITAEEVFYGSKGKAFPGLLFAAVAAVSGYCDQPTPVAMEDEKEVTEYLQGVLKSALLADYRQRLDTAVSVRMVQHKAEEQKTQSVRREQAERLQAAQVSQMVKELTPIMRQSAAALPSTKPGGGRVSMLFCGHVGGGKSTMMGRLLAVTGNLPVRELEKYERDAAALGKHSWTFAFAMMRRKEERERGISTELSKSAFATANGPCSLMDAPGHRDFIRNAIRGIAQTDVGLIVLPVDFYQAALDRGDRRLARDIGYSRLHMLLLVIQGVKQFVVLVNRMDSVNYEEKKFEEAKTAAIACLVACGLKPENVPILPVSGWAGDNIVTVSPLMPWWKGHGVVHPLNKKEMTIHSLKEVIDNFAVAPPRTEGEFLAPISGVFKIKGVGTVATGRIEQGVCHPNQTVFVGEEKYTLATIETHHVSLSEGKAGDICGFNLKAGTGKNPLKVGELLSLSPRRPVRSFVAQVQVVGPFHYKVGYEALCIVRTAIATCKITAIAWSAVGEAAKTNNPAEIKNKDRAEITFKCSVPMPVLPFEQCQGLGRVTMLGQDNIVDMIGKVTAIFDKPPAVQVQQPRRGR